MIHGTCHPGQYLDPSEYPTCSHCGTRRRELVEGRCGPGDEFFCDVTAKTRRDAENRKALPSRSRGGHS